jgi:hypothetical protein
MDARRAPQWIVRAHPPDQRPKIGIDLRPTSQASGFPTPIPAKAGAVPTHEGCGLNDRDRLQDRRKPSIQLDEEKAITARELDTPPHLPPQHGQLLPKYGILCLKPALQFEWRGEQRQ